MFEEFKKFALRGNVVDLAVGVIIGVAFGAIVTSLVNDIIMPLIGAITGGLDFSNYYTALSSKVQPGLSLCRREKARCRARMGPVSNRRDQFSYYRMGFIPGDQRHKQIEKRRTSSARSWADTRGKAAHRNSRLAEK